MSNDGDLFQILLLGMLGLLCQTRLTIRASRLFRRRPILRRWFLGVMLVVIGVAWAASVVSFVNSIAINLGWEAKFGPLNYNIIVGVYLWLSAAIDVALSLTLSLTIRRSIAHFNLATDHRIRQIMRTSMITALYTSVIGIVGAVLSVALPMDGLLANCLFAFSSGSHLRFGRRCFPC